MKDGLGIEIPPVLGKLYPNGEFVVWKPRCTQDNPLDSMLAPVGVVDRIHSLIDAEMPEGDYAAERLSSLGLSIDPILNPLPTGDFKPRAIKGLGGITSHGRRMLRNGCFILERKYKTSTLSFLTLTLPGLPEYQLEEVQKNWSDVMQRFKNEFAKTIRDKQLPLDYVYCVEVQEFRARRENFPVLHIHMVFVGRRSPRSAWALSPSMVDAMWKKTLEAVLRTTVDVKCACRIEAISKSAEGYISKYISKGSARLQEWWEEGMHEFLPSHWWGMSTSLRTAVRGQTYYGQLVGESLEELMTNKENYKYCKRIDIVWRGITVTVGRYGRLSEEVRKCLASFFDKTDELPF